jgi:hypothetical protein
VNTGICPSGSHDTDFWVEQGRNSLVHRFLNWRGVRLVLPAVV